jgi:hypothetical protein
MSHHLATNPRFADFTPEAKEGLLAVIASPSFNPDHVLSWDEIKWKLADRCRRRRSQQLEWIK